MTLITSIVKHGAYAGKIFVSYGYFHEVFHDRYQHGRQLPITKLVSDPVIGPLFMAFEKHGYKFMDPGQIMVGTIDDKLVMIPERDIK